MTETMKNVYATSLTIARLINNESNFFDLSESKRAL